MTFFVTWKMQPTKNINSTPTIIFGAAADNLPTCRISSTLLTNMTANTIYVSLYFQRETEDYILGNKILILPYATADFFKDFTLTAQKGDQLYAFSDYSSSVFNVFVSYEALNETL